MTREESVFQEFGYELMSARKESGRSVDDIALETKIHRRYIEAIEAGDMNALPPGPYTKAFVREYARAVGLPVPAEFSLAGVATPAKTKQASQKPVVNGADKPKAEKPKNEVHVIPTAAIKATKETARLANVAVKVAAKTAVKTTESVLKKVEESAKEAADVITSKSLWDEAGEVRRERLGLVSKPIEETPLPTRPENPRPEIPAADTKAVASAESIPPTPSLQEIHHSTGAGVLEESTFHVQSKPQKIAIDPELAQPKEKRKGGNAMTYVVIIGALLLFGALAYYAVTQDKKQKSSAVATQGELENVSSSEARKRLEQAQASSATDTKPVTAPEPEQPAATEPVKQDDSLRFSITATDNVWVSIAQDNGNAFKGELKKGETRSFKASEKFIVNIGNQKSVTMHFNGQPLSQLPTIPNSGVVVRDLVLLRDKVVLGGKDISSSNTVATSKEVNTPTSSTHTTVNGAAPHSAVSPKSNTPGTKNPATKTPSQPIKKPTTTKKKASTKGVKSIEPVEPVLPRP